MSDWLTNPWVYLPLVFYGAVTFAMLLIGAIYIQAKILRGDRVPYHVQLIVFWRLLTWPYSVFIAKNDWSDLDEMAR